MFDKRTLHAKIQELCDCFATADPLLEMSRLGVQPMDEESALKWIALVVLHGINANAKKITLTKTADGRVRAEARYRKTGLPSPGAEIGGKILEIMREITHLEQETGRTPLALGIRDGSLELVVKSEKDKNGETLSIEFPG